MSNEQLYLAIGVPILFNGMMLTLLFLAQNRQIDSVNKRIDDINKRIDDLAARIDKRFDDMRDMWRTELKAEIEKLKTARHQ